MRLQKLISLCRLHYYYCCIQILLLSFKGISCSYLIDLLNAKPPCSVHLARYSSSSSLGQNPPFNYDHHTTSSNQIIPELHEKEVPHSSATHSYHWGVRNYWLPFGFLPSLNFGHEYCLTFLLIDPSPEDILGALDHSGHFVNKSPLFIIYLTREQYGTHFTPNKVIWPARLFATDANLLFLIESEPQKGMELGLFCYFCLVDKIQLLKFPGVAKMIMTPSLRDWVIERSNELNNDAMGNPIFVEKNWWIGLVRDPDRCRPFSPRSSWSNDLTCFPTERYILHELVHKFNTTLSPDDGVKTGNFWNPPYFPPIYNMIIISGPISRLFGSNYTKEFLINITSDKLIYCVDKFEVSSGILGMLSSLVQPFNPSVWIALLSTIFLMIIVVRPEDPLGMAGIILGNGYIPRFVNVVEEERHLNQKTRSVLVVFWSLLMSTSVSHLYDAILTADMLVPLPEYRIKTFEELIFKGYKIGYMRDFSLAGAAEWYLHKFERSSKIQGWENRSFVHIDFNGKMHEEAIDRAGKLAIFKTDTFVGPTLQEIRVSLLNRSEVVCQVVDEPILDMVMETSQVMFHLSTEFVRTMRELMESGIPKALTKLRIWQTTDLQEITRRAHRDKGIPIPEKELEGFKASGFHYGSKFPVIFLAWACGLGISGFAMGFEVIVHLIVSSSLAFWVLSGYAMWKVKNNRV
jgi:hypothetical protein